MSLLFEAASTAINYQLDQDPITVVFCWKVIGIIVQKYEYLSIRGLSFVKILAMGSSNIDSILASHPAPLGTILSIPKNFSLDVDEIYWRHFLEKWPEAWSCQSNLSSAG